MNLTAFLFAALVGLAVTGAIVGWTLWKRGGSQLLRAQLPRVLAIAGCAAASVGAVILLTGVPGSTVVVASAMGVCGFAFAVRFARTGAGLRPIALLTAVGIGSTLIAILALLMPWP